MTFSHAVCIPLMPRRRSTTLLGLELGLGLGLGSGSGLGYLGLGLGAGARPSSTSPGCCRFHSWELYSIACGFVGW